MEPKYAENIIAGVIFKKKFQWYLTDKTIWKLDYRKMYDEWHETYRQRGKTEVEFVKEVGSFGEFLSTRFRIPVVDRDNAKEFLKQLRDSAVSGGELAYQFVRAETAAQRLALVPVFLVDFDNKRFFSQFPEKENFERYVPAGWQGAYADFTAYVPADERYWIEPEI